MAEQPAEIPHEPVLVEETLQYLRPRGGTVIDATVGFGGHARAILSHLDSGRLVGFDLDPEAVEPPLRIEMLDLLSALAAVTLLMGLGVLRQRASLRRLTPVLAGAVEEDRKALSEMYQRVFGGAVSLACLQA